MGYRKLFIDSDILLDMLMARQPFSDFTQILLEEARNRQLDINTSVLIFANMHYVISKKFNKDIARQQLKKLAGMIKILPLGPDDITGALNNEHADFEDTVQYYVAQKHHCDLIISRNIKHYKKFDIPVATAADFLKTL